jgi:hypothetical protein
MAGIPLCEHAISYFRDKKHALERLEYIGCVGGLDMGTPRPLRFASGSWPILKKTSDTLNAFAVP